MENLDKKNPPPNQDADPVRVSWEHEPADDAGHRLNLIFNLLFGNKLG